jgi:hypothetical protein
MELQFFSLPAMARSWSVVAWLTVAVVLLLPAGTLSQTNAQPRAMNA